MYWVVPHVKENVGVSKIYILSMQRTVNFGSVLQAWSLRNLLKEISDRQIGFLDIDGDMVLPSGRVLSEAVDYEVSACYPPGLLQKVKRRCIRWLSSYNKYLIRRFMKRDLVLKTPEDAGEKELVVVGSDEVFNHTRGVNLQLHGSVAGARRVITYAASCGSALPQDVRPQDRESVRSALENIETISVRDAATERYVEELSGRKTVHHLDPVLVGSLPQRKPRRVLLKKYLLVYAYGQRIRTREEIYSIREFARARGLKVVAMGGSQFWCDLYIPASPMRLLDYFHAADYVVTDTFHGTIFSVINHRKFAVIPRVTNQAKIAGLLEDLGLTERLVSCIEQLEKILPAQVDYHRVDDILTQERERTRDYLRTYLEE